MTPTTSLSVTLSHQMGGSSEKSLSDWMVRQGMVRRVCLWQGPCPGGAVRGSRTLDPEESKGLHEPLGGQGPTAPNPALGVVLLPPLLLPQPLCAHFRLLSWKQGPGIPSGSWRQWGLPSSGRSASGQPSGRGSWCGQPRALAAAAGAAGKVAPASLGFLLPTWGLRCWRHSLGIEWAWREKDSLPLYKVAPR